MFGLPESVGACLFDLDSVPTQTAKVRAAAWKEMFDGFLGERAAKGGEPFRPFDPVADYDEYVDGKPRYLAARAASATSNAPTHSAEAACAASPVSTPTPTGRSSPTTPTPTATTPPRNSPASDE
jgi:beta-phosphoglucomutase-like phosphatase (HAD superfamily)